MNLVTKVCFTTLNQLNVIPHLYLNKKIVYKVNNKKNNFYCWVMQLNLTKTVMWQNLSRQGAHKTDAGTYMKHVNFRVLKDFLWTQPFHFMFYWKGFQFISRVEDNPWIPIDLVVEKYDVPWEHDANLVVLCIPFLTTISNSFSVTKRFF